MSDNTLYGRMSEIRDLINIPRKQHVLLQDRAMWHKLCDSMDAIEDTEKVLENFLKEDVKSSNKSIEHLPPYEVLDTVVAQQAAVKNLHGAFNLSYTEDSSLAKIRQVCIDAMEDSTDRGDENDSIKILDLITTQRSIFWKSLNDIVKTLKKEDLKHRRKFAGERLSSAFQGTTYPFEKIYDAIFSEDSPHALIAGFYVDEILKSVEKFKTGLEKRGEPDDNISYIYENLDYSLQQIKAYFTKETPTHIKEKDVYIFAYFVRRQVRELEQIAQDLDNEYNREYIS